MKNRQIKEIDKPCNDLKNWDKLLPCKVKKGKRTTAY